MTSSTITNCKSKVCMVSVGRITTFNEPGAGRFVTSGANDVQLESSLATSACPPETSLVIITPYVRPPAPCQELPTGALHAKGNLVSLVSRCFNQEVDKL